MYNEMSRVLNFTYSLYMVPDGQFGARNSTTGVWSGIVGELLAGVTCFSCSTISTYCEICADIATSIIILPRRTSSPVRRTVTEKGKIRR